VAALVDTNVLVYRFDPRFPRHQEIATDLLRRGLAEDTIRVPHQAVVEFVAAVTRPLGDGELRAAHGDFQHDRLYGTVRVVNPFLALTGSEA
jgi:predicted nucleic acid-binding protein